MIWTLVMRYWKIWLPAILVLGVATTIWAQASRIDSLKEERDVAIYEHDRVAAENKSILDDIDRLNKIILRRQEQIKRIEADYSAAMGRLKALSQARPDVRDWIGSRLPDGMWKDIRGYKEGATSGDPAATDRGGDNGADNERRTAEPVPAG